MSARHDMETRFAGVIDEGRLFGRDESVLVAVSGGADSVALLNLLHAINAQEGWSLKLHVAHLNHQLRGTDADNDAAFVEGMAQQLRVAYTIETADMRARSQAEGVSIEQAGRLGRLEFYERVCLRYGIKALAVAHNADDNAETILHRIIRGTGIRGLVGIKPRRSIRAGSEIRIVRPLLGFSRAEIEEYLRDRGIGFCHDITNDSNAFTRNRIRNEILPLLREKFNPQVSEALLRLAGQARGLDEYLREVSERALESLIIEHDSRHLVLHCPSLIQKPRVIRMELVRQAVLRMGIGERNLSYGHLSTVVDLAGQEVGGKGVDLPEGLHVSRRYSRLVFERSGGREPKALPGSEVRVSMDGTTLLPHSNIELSLEVVLAGERLIADHLDRLKARISGKYSYEEWVDADKVHPPLIARLRRPGDRFFPLGMSGMKKLSDFFIVEKIDADCRERSVVLCDQLGPIWIVPLRIDERVRLTRVTKRVLRLQARQIGACEH